MQAEAIKVAQQLEDATEEAEAWGTTLGTGQRSPPGQKLELGKRLAGNEKLKKLAREAMEPEISASPEEFAAFVRRDHASYEPIVKSSGAKAD